MTLEKPKFSHQAKDIQSDTQIGHVEHPIFSPTKHLPMQRPQRAEHFTGRETELDKLINDLHPAKVFTLCGTEGIGKSALAAEAVWHLAPANTPPKQFPDGIISHDFNSTPQAELALEHIALSLGEKPKPSPLLAAKRALSGRKVLLLLDGTENADNLQKVLCVAESCGVLATNRKHSDAVSGWKDIKPLPLENSIQILRFGNENQVFDDETAQRICELLGDLPLAFRLAGRYMNQTGEGAPEYLAWLEKTPLKALDHDQRRLDSIPLLLERSLKQVSESTQKIFYLSGLLAFSPFSQEVVAAALKIPADIVKSGLEQLYLLGLLTKLKNSETYKVSHALIHTHISHKKLLEPSTKKRLISYYTSLAEDRCQRGREGYARLDIEKAHLMRVLTICKDGLHQRALIDFVWAVDDYLDSKGYWLDRRLALEAGVKAAQQQQNQDSESVLLGCLGNAYRDLGEVEKAIDHYERALVIAREVGDRHSEGSWLGNLGLAYYDLGQAEKAIEHYERALVIFREIGDRRYEGNCSKNLGLAYCDLSEVHKAIEHYEQALVIVREAGDRHNESYCLGYLGNAYSDLGEVTKSIENYEQALVIAREVGDRHNESYCLGYLGIAYSDLGEVHKVIEYNEQALVIAREVGDRHIESYCLENLGYAYSDLGEVTKSIEYYEQALVIAREVGDRHTESYCLGYLGNAYSDLGEVRKAKEYLIQSLGILKEIESPFAENVRHWLGKLEQ